MPGGDRTGPAGMGPMTGRAAGYCAGYSVPGYMNPGPGGGYWGRGGGWGRRNWYRATGLTGWQRAATGYPPTGAPWGYAAPYAGNYPYAAGPTKEQELESLRAQASYLEESLTDIKNRIDELEEQTGESQE